MAALVCCTPVVDDAEYAMHQLEIEPTREVRIHPDGQHARQFDFPGWLERRGFHWISAGKTSFTSVYEDVAGRRIVIHFQLRIGDVVAQAGDLVIEAECKGGRTYHRGRLSRLDKLLGEIVGRLMSKPSPGPRVAVMPKTDVTPRLARRLAARCAAANANRAGGPQGEAGDVGD